MKKYNCNFEELKGLTFKNISVNNNEIRFYVTDDTYFHMHHYQDCCECVYIEDICGDIQDLIGHRILEAECVTNHDNPKEYAEFFTWTFYKISTIKGSVTIRWYGESNGYYSESVDLDLIDNREKTEDPSAY